MTRYLVPALAVALSVAGTSRADISFSIGGLAGTGVTADVTFSYLNQGATDGILTITIKNTSTDVIGEEGNILNPRISGFGFNAPAGVNSIDVLVDMVTAPTELATTVIDPNEDGWWALFESGGIKAPNAAGNFDFGVLNSGENPNKFITDGAGLVPSIAPDETNSFTFAIGGAGMGSFNEATFLSELSIGGAAGEFSFGARFQGIGLDGDSDFAVFVPVPGAALLGLIGMGLVGSLRRKMA